MKKQSENRFSLLTRQDVANLAHTVKETLAIVRPKTFSAAELWDIQRRSRTMASRRNFAM